MQEIDFEAPTYRNWLLVAEHFTAPQGEGPFMGRPAFWTRLGGCNQHCGWCDSAFTWAYDDRHVEMTEAKKKYDPRKELRRESITQLIKVLRDQHLRRYVITGGEPLLQSDGVSRLISGINDIIEDASFEIETAGSIAPGELKLYDNVWFNVSPKLNSSGNGLDLRRNIPALIELRQLPSCFKFVIDTRDIDRMQDDIDEACELIEILELTRERIWLMPCGDTAEQVVNGMRKLEPIVVASGFNLSSRLQTIMHGDERGH